MKSQIKKIVAVVLVVIAVVLAFPMNVSAKSAELQKGSMEDKLITMVNAARKEAGLSELQYNADMEAGADLRASEAAKKWSHTRPNGEEYWTADADHIYGENLSKDYSSASDIMNGWMNSSTHKDNILFKDYKTCAVGVLKNGSGTYCVAFEFGY